MWKSRSVRNFQQEQVTKTRSIFAPTVRTVFKPEGPVKLVGLSDSDLCHASELCPVLWRRRKMKNWPENRQDGVCSEVYTVWWQEDHLVQGPTSLTICAESLQNKFQCSLQRRFLMKRKWLFQSAHKSSSRSDDQIAPVPGRLTDVRIAPHTRRMGPWHRSEGCICAANSEDKTDYPTTPTAYDLWAYTQFTANQTMERRSVNGIHSVESRWQKMTNQQRKVNVDQPGRLCFLTLSSIERTRNFSGKTWFSSVACCFMLRVDAELFTCLRSLFISVLIVSKMNAASIVNSWENSLQKPGNMRKLRSTFDPTWRLFSWITVFVNHRQISVSLCWSDCGAGAIKAPILNDPLNPLSCKEKREAILRRTLRKLSRACRTQICRSFFIRNSQNIESGPWNQTEPTQRARSRQTPTTVKSWNPEENISKGMFSIIDTFFVRTSVKMDTSLAVDFYNIKDQSLMFRVKCKLSKYDSRARTTFQSCTVRFSAPVFQIDSHSGHSYFSSSS